MSNPVAVSPDAAVEGAPTTANELEVPKSHWLFMKNSDGQPSASVTFATVSFFVTTAWVVLSMFSKIGPIVIRPFDPTAATSYMLPLITLYMSRRWVAAKYGK